MGTCFLRLKKHVFCVCAKTCFFELKTPVFDSTKNMFSHEVKLRTVDFLNNRIQPSRPSAIVLSMKNYARVVYT